MKAFSRMASRIILLVPFSPLLVPFLVPFSPTWREFDVANERRLKHITQNQHIHATYKIKIISVSNWVLKLNNFEINKL